MIRPKHIWVTFGVCLVVALAALVWISRTVIRLDRAQAEAQRQASLEENVRLALWRMESALAPLVAQESARPYFQYSAFYPTERAYTRMFAEIEQGEILVPSPLLTFNSPHVLLHFQFDPQGNLTSPQVPNGNMRDLAEAAYTTHAKIEISVGQLSEFQALVEIGDLRGHLQGVYSRPVTRQVIQKIPEDHQDRTSAGSQMARNTVEWQVRELSQTANVLDNAGINRLQLSSDVREGTIKPVWVGTALVLARRVSVNGGEYIQGCWLDWPTMKGELTENIRDLLPNADLEAVILPDADQHARMLAALPIRLVPGSAPAQSPYLAWPIRVSFFIAWACLLLAASAVAMLLVGAVSLSERRGAFVSAVTHELRTPLTTFRMYTEMLAEDMVPEEKKRHYFDTLQTEAERLGHLVENVLAYARLEGDGVSSRIETMPISKVLDQVKTRLSERAEQAGMNLAVHIENEMNVQVDLSAVEQILFNLVDNACKYAVPALKPLIQIEIGRKDKYAVIRVRDHGPGIEKGDKKRLFAPFCKSDRDKVNSAPGVGLGLALSRRLARNMHGDLRLDESVKDGACFALLLPLV
ncbi:MAG: HAMP domain-containing sensor histidine kinase [bacterium]